MSYRAKQIADLINEHQFKRYCEVGVWKGETTEYVRRNCPSLEHIIGVDPLDANINNAPETRCTMGEEPKSQEELDEMARHHMNRQLITPPVYTFLRGTSQQMVSKIGDRWCDIVFIDAAHDYKNVKQDVQLWLPKIRHGGILAGHDYNYFPGVKRALDELFAHVNLGMEFTWWVYV